LHNPLQREDSEKTSLIKFDVFGKLAYKNNYLLAARKEDSAMETINRIIKKGT
jgi:hypothetical protein